MILSFWIPACPRWVIACSESENSAIRNLQSEIGKDAIENRLPFTALFSI
jgi:hypothetical protein